jgi:hypothetical protein
MTFQEFLGEWNIEGRGQARWCSKSTLIASVGDCPGLFGLAMSITPDFCRTKAIPISVRIPTQ